VLGAEQTEGDGRDFRRSFVLRKERLIMRRVLDVRAAPSDHRTPCGSDGAVEAASVVSSQIGVPSVRTKHCATGRQVAGSNLDGVIGNFSLTLSFRPHCASGVDWPSNRYE
jgi:hypothetical protein